MDGFPIQDMLREFLLRGEDSINADLLNSIDSKEFLWKVFCHLAFGGPVNQFEDDLSPYRQASKALYKDLVTCAYQT